MVLDGDKGLRFRILKARGPGKFISPRLTKPRELIPRYRRQDLWIALVVCDWLAPVYGCVPLLITFRMGFCAIKLDAVFHKEIRRNKAHAV